MNRGTWKIHEKQYIEDHYKDQTADEMAEYLCKSVVAVKQYMLRNRISIQKVDHNIVYELIARKFVDPNYFRPTRAFYKATKITQERWGDIFLGRKQVTQEEYIAICDHLHVSLAEAFESRQLKLFIND